MSGIVASQRDIVRTSSRSNIKPVIHGDGQKQWKYLENAVTNTRTEQDAPKFVSNTKKLEMKENENLSKNEQKGK